MKARKCSLCGFKGMVFHSTETGSVCANRTRCLKRRRSTEVHIQTFIRRLRKMNEEQRFEWVAALRQEIWPSPKKK